MLTETFRVNSSTSSLLLMTFKLAEYRSFGGFLHVVDITEPSTGVKLATSCIYKMFTTDMRTSIDGQVFQPIYGSNSSKAFYHSVVEQDRKDDVHD